MMNTHQPKPIRWVATPSAMHGFTLIEMLVVMMIVLVLAATVIKVTSALQTRAQVHQAKAEVAMLIQALERYKMDNGRYPSGSPNQGSGAYIIGDALERGGYIRGWPKDRKAGAYLDPWMRPYQYDHLQTANWGAGGGNSAEGSQIAYLDREMASIIVFSYGPDGARGTADDIVGNVGAGAPGGERSAQ